VGRRGGAVEAGHAVSWWERGEVEGTR